MGPALDQSTVDQALVDRLTSDIIDAIDTASTDPDSGTTTLRLVEITSALSSVCSAAIRMTAARQSR